MQFKDYYQVLGVPRTASDDEIKKSFRRLARQHHPDVAKDKKRSEEKFKEINEAYEVLGNAENRRKYDELGPSWRAGSEFRPPPGFGRRRAGRRSSGSADAGEMKFGGAGFSDFFESLFGGRRQGGGGNGGFGGFGSFGDFEASEPAGRSGLGRGADVEGEIQVSLDEVLRGSVRSVTMQRMQTRTGQPEPVTFQVRIPPGVKEGQMIRVAGKGEVGSQGVSGDLYLRVRVGAHPDFEVRGDDLVTELTLAPWEAVLGATVSAPTLDGPVQVRVPAGSRKGHRLRVRGRGLPTPGGERGDLYLDLRIDVPPAATEEEKSLWERLAKVSAYRPRGR